MARWCILNGLTRMPVVGHSQGGSDHRGADLVFGQKRIVYYIVIGVSGPHVFILGRKPHGSDEGT